MSAFARGGGFGGNPQRQIAGLIALVAGLYVAPRGEADRYFRWLPGEVVIQPHGISPVGNTVVGRHVFNAGGEEGFRWTNANGIEVLGDLEGGLRHAEALDASENGHVIVGYGTWGGAGDWEATRWTRESGVIGIGDLPGDPQSSIAQAVSRDGNVIVGFGHTRRFGDPQAFRWSEADGMEGLGFLYSKYPRSSATDVSRDGSVIVGWSSYNRWSDAEAFVWTRDNGMIGLGFPDFAFESNAHAVSADGTTVVGVLRTNDGEWGGYQAFVWTAQEGMLALGDIEGGPTYSHAYAVSGDGSIVVGFGTGPEDREAFIWDRQNGLRNLQHVLATEYGIEFERDTWLAEATAISDDGTAIAGIGFDETWHGIGYGWIAHIGTACDRSRELLGDSNGDGNVDFEDIECFVTALIDQNHWVECNTSYDVSSYLCVNDMDGNEAVDFEDIDEFIDCLIDERCGP